MALEAWLPVGFILPDGARARLALHEGVNWQIVETMGSGRALLAQDPLVKRWLASGLIAEGALAPFMFGARQYWAITNKPFNEPSNKPFNEPFSEPSSEPSLRLCPVSDVQSPNNKSEALSFAQALKATREIDPQSALQDALYVEALTRLLPTYSISSRVRDDIVLGYALTGGSRIAATSFRRLQHAMSWLGASHLREVVEAAGFEVPDSLDPDSAPSNPAQDKQAKASDAGVQPRASAPVEPRVFTLEGRPELAAFFNDHIVEIIMHRDRYQAFGIGFPSALVLHGPPGCGKTYAVEQLIEFLGWPSFSIDASSVASPFIHETSKKVAQTFDKAMQNAPSVLVIDEMEAFLADRTLNYSQQHHVEEVAEFLRRIPEAVKREVLVIAMTNRIEMVDAAILRRGRFDHVIMVDFASEEEVLSLLNKLLASLPREPDVDAQPLAKQLAGRPLSDVAFVVREGSRLAARSGLDHLDQAHLLLALKATAAREREGGETKRRIGFI